MKNDILLCLSIYFTGLSWDSALKKTKISLQLFDDEEMYTFMEKSIRGGISQISKRYAKANNPKCPDYDPLKPISHLIYLDCTNLYGFSMKCFLPTHGFRWLRSDEINKLVIQNLNDEADDGYIFEVREL